MEPFVYLPTYSIIVCKQCEFGCVADEVTTHLRARHSDISVPKRRCIQQAIQFIPGVIRNQADLNRLELPPSSTTPLPYLAAPKADGLKCRKCSYISRQIQKIQAHCRSEHGWQNPRASGRPVRADARATQQPWRENVQCQRFFPSRIGSGWFEVTGPDGRRRSAQNVPLPVPQLEPLVKPNRLTPETRAHLNSILQREAIRQRLENQPRVISKALGEASPLSIGPWLEHTQWPTMFHGCRRDILRAMTYLPVRCRPMKEHVLGQGQRDGDVDIVSPLEDEQMIACILGALDHILDRCEYTAQHTHRSLLHWLVSSKANVCSPKQFVLVAEQSSRQRYWRIWKRFIAFVLRAYRLERKFRRQDVRISISDQLDSQLRCIWQHEVWEFVNPSSGTWPQSAGRREVPLTFHSYKFNPKPIFEEEMGQSYDPGGNGEALELDDSPGETSSDGDSDSSDEELNYSASFDDELEFLEEDPDDHGTAFTRDSAADIGAVVKACDEFLELLFQLNLSLCMQPLVNGHPGSTLLVRFSGILGFSPDSRNFLMARQYRPYLSPLIYIQRLLFLEYALPICSYPSLGILQRPSIKQSERLEQIRKEHMVFGSASSYTELLSLRNTARVVARADPPAILLRWSEDGQTVYCGDKFNLHMRNFPNLAEHFTTRAEELCRSLMFGTKLDVDLTKVRDDMSNSQCGYSFVKHPANGLENAYKELLVRASTISTGSLVKHGRWSWNAVSSFLKNTTRLEEMLLGGLHVACGQTPRIRELLSLQVENSPSAKRGIFVWNGYIIYVTQHHKTKRQTNREFYVARFLPARLGNVLFRYLVCIRPLADLLGRERLSCGGLDKPVPRRCLLFHSGGISWKPVRLTTMLKKSTMDAWGYAVNAQLHRQVSIGITEKHVREVRTPQNRYDDNSATADINVVYAWQSGHRPLQRGTTYGLDGAFPHQLQPALLRVYEWASVRWHEFIRQPSKVVPTLSSQNQLLTAKASKRTIEEFLRDGEGPADIVPAIHKKPITAAILKEQSDPTPIQLALWNETAAEGGPFVVHPSTARVEQRRLCLRLDDVLCLLHEH